MSFMKLLRHSTFGKDLLAEAHKGYDQQRAELTKRRDALVKDSEQKRAAVLSQIPGKQAECDEA
jgi:hypothetical protein